MNLLEKLKATCEIDSGGHFLLCLFNFMLLIILEIMSLFLGIPNVGYLTIIYNPIVMLFCFCFMGFLIYDYYKCNEVLMDEIWKEDKKVD